MKKYSIAAAMVALSMSAFAQKANLKATDNALYEPMDLAEAKKNIEPAMTHPETANQAKTFNLAGKTYFLTYEDIAKNGKKDPQGVKDNLLKATDAYFKAWDLDQQPNEKGKVKPAYAKEIKSKLNRLQEYLIGEGNNCYTSQDYKGAVALWTKYMEIPNSPAMAGTPKDSIYNDIYFFAINAAMLDEDLKKKEAITMMEDFKNVDHKDASKMYDWLYQTYLETGDTVKAVNTLKEGIAKDPNNKFLFGSLINYYISSKKVDEAVKYLDEAIAKNPKEVQYHIVKGNSLMQAKEYDKAISAFNAALAVDANNFEAYSGIGAVYMMKGQDLYNEAGKIPVKQKAKYDAAVKTAKAEFQKAVEPLEKARSIDAKNFGNLQMLRSVYMQLNQGAKADAIQKEISNLNDQK
ncbi:MAG: tetratricopeptide repeat protein [Bacteroidales bacterium]|nr:tetratricopeptide repeat protein [Bacteroidales bacterium]